MKTKVNIPDTDIELVEELENIELVKPTPMNEIISQEVEALCESFYCNSHCGKSTGDTSDADDILF